MAAFLTWNTVSSALQNESKLLRGVSDPSKLNLKIGIQGYANKLVQQISRKSVRCTLYPAGRPRSYHSAKWQTSKIKLDSLPAEYLHSEQREDENEERQEQQQTRDGAHAVQQRRHQVTQRRPVSVNEHKEMRIPLLETSW